MSVAEEVIAKIKKKSAEAIQEPFKQFIRSSSSGGILLIIATVCAIIIANSPLGLSYETFWETKFTIGADFFKVSKPFILWLNDGLMAIFFLLVGLEIKREFIAGELASVRKAAFPLIAAIGGMILPITFFTILNKDGVGSQGWGIPMATDIAFSIGILSLLGKRVPIALKVFLVTFAIVDDIGAVLVIACFYSEQILWSSLIIAALLFVFLIILNLLHVKKVSIYMITGSIIWYLFLMSGVHPTIAGVLLAFTIPLKRRVPIEDLNNKLINFMQDLNSKPSENSIVLSKSQIISLNSMGKYIKSALSPLQTLENTLHDFVTFIVMPLFAFANTGIIFGNLNVEIFNELTVNISTSLILGKVTGIFLFSYIAVKIGIATLPKNVNWKHILGIAMLGGVGFTMSLFISSLAYTDIVILNQARIGILLGSLIAATLGYLFLKANLKKDFYSNN
ncbi:Na+/H+ antiporter NhaA [Bacteroidota bacterium]